MPDRWPPLAHLEQARSGHADDGPRSARLAHCLGGHSGGSRACVAHSRLQEKEPQKVASGGQTITLPYRVCGTLKAGFVKGEADWVMREAVDMPADDRVSHLGDPFGRVFAWVWNDDKDVAMMLLSDYMAELREGHLLAAGDTEVRIVTSSEDVLKHAIDRLPDILGSSGSYNYSADSQDWQSRDS
jgi:hypothetical protein